MGLDRIRAGDRLRILAALILLTAIATPRAHARPVAVGGHGGLSIAAIRGDDHTRFERYTVGAGLFARYAMSPALSLQPGVLIVSKGGSMGGIALLDPFDGSVSSHQVIRDLSYVELPILLRFAHAEPRRFQPYFLVGPSFAFEINETTRLQDRSIPAEDLGMGDTDRLHDFDMGLVAGGGFELGRGPIRWMLESRGNLGVLDLDSSVPIDPGAGTPEYTHYNWNVLISLGIVIDPARLGPEIR